jgi:hypothetical protein
MSPVVEQAIARLTANIPLTHKHWDGSETPSDVGIVLTELRRLQEENEDLKSDIENWQFTG